jgi:hypothetical protein
MRNKKNYLTTASQQITIRASQPARQLTKINEIGWI